MALYTVLYCMQQVVRWSMRRLVEGGNLKSVIDRAGMLSSIQV